MMLIERTVEPGAILPSIIPNLLPISDATDEPSAAA
jgi:hypothetical protein